MGPRPGGLFFMLANFWGPPNKKESVIPWREFKIGVIFFPRGAPRGDPQGGVSPGGGPRGVPGSCSGFPSGEQI